MLHARFLRPLAKARAFGMTTELKPHHYQKMRPFARTSRVVQRVNRISPHVTSGNQSPQLLSKLGRDFRGGFACAFRLSAFLQEYPVFSSASPLGDWDHIQPPISQRKRKPQNQLSLNSRRRSCTQ